MRSFAGFLKEDMTQLDSHQFPRLSVLPHGHERIGKILAVLNPALKAGVIQNVALKIIKHELSYLHEAVKTKIGEDHTYGGRYKSLPSEFQELDLTLGDPHHVPGKMKKLEKSDAQHPIKADYLAYGKELSLILNALASLKDKVVKRQPKPEEERSKTYIPPSASRGAMGVVLKVLTHITDETKVKFAADLEHQYIRQVQDRFDHPRTRQEMLAGKRTIDVFVDSFLMTRVGENFDGFNGGNYTSLKSDWKTILKQMADREAVEVQQQFIAKNVRKLATIIEDKGNNLRGDPQVLSAYVMSNGFGGEIKVRFEDGAEFIVRNKSVWKINANGTQFAQFPTTFHNVLLPGGKPMSNPSEERMITVFATSSTLKP